MKAIRLNALRKSIFLGLLTTMIMFLIDSCAIKARFLNSSVVPAAEGYAKIKKDKNQNYVIQIYITNLAEVSRLQTSKQTYVIWMVTNEGTSKNIGRLKTTSSELFSKSMKASFETVSSFKPSKIFITAEVDGSIQYPDSQIVLTTGSF